jgi:hypothetical protein
MCLRNERLGSRLVNAGKRDIQRDGQRKAAAAVRPQADGGYYLNIVVLDLLFLVAGDMDYRITETGGITSSKKLLGIGRAALTAKATGHREPEVKKSIGAFYYAVTTADGVNCR